MKIKTYNVKTGDEAVLSGFDAVSRREAREIAIALGICMTTEIGFEDGFFVIEWNPSHQRTRAA